MSPALILALVLAAQTTGPAGTYSVSVTTTGPTTIVQTANSLTITWTPPPAPTPTPPPTPAPVPTLTGHVWALAIEDPSQPHATYLDDQTLHASALLQDVDIQASKTTDPAAASWLPHLLGGSKSGLLFVTKDEKTGHGVLGYATVLPGSAADLLSLVNKVRGK